MLVGRREPVYSVGTVAVLVAAVWRKYACKAALTGTLAASHIRHQLGADDLAVVDFQFRSDQ
jgi:hypothetical protein